MNDHRSEASDELPIRIGVSACLLGLDVRYDGRNKAEHAVIAMAPEVEWVPVCPEVSIGLGVPRESIQLVVEAVDQPLSRNINEQTRPEARLKPSPSALRLLGVHSQNEHTQAMHAFCRAMFAELERLNICGYVFKQNSPSCGVVGVSVHDRAGNAIAETSGMFAGRLLQAFPGLPVAEEPDIRDDTFRRGFLQRAKRYRQQRVNRHTNRERRER